MYIVLRVGDFDGCVLWSISYETNKYQSLHIKNDVKVYYLDFQSV